MARARARKYTCRACIKAGKARPYKADSPQKIRVHRVKAHGDVWKKNPRKGSTSSVPMKERSTQPRPTLRYCTSCGTRKGAGWTFCGKCGTKIAARR